MSRRNRPNDYGSCSSLSAQPASTWKTGSETKKSCGLGSDGYQTVTKCAHNHRGTRVVLLVGSANCKIFAPPVNPGGVHREGTSAPPDTAGESGVGGPEGVRRGPRARRGGARSDPARHPLLSVTSTQTRSQNDPSGCWASAQVPDRSNALHRTHARTRTCVRAWARGRSRHPSRRLSAGATSRATHAIAAMKIAARRELSPARHPQ